MRILVIEDESKTAEYLRKGLSEHGYIVDVCHDGEEGIYQSTSLEYDIIILDVMLPKSDGWTVLAGIRKAGKKTPVLFLTARDAVYDRVKGLELGADDYLIKPFAFFELLARVRSVLRRAPARQPEVLRVADLEIDLLKRKAFRGPTRLELTPKEFALLTFLAQRKGEVLSRTLLAEQVWDMNFDSNTNIVDVAIRRLRKKADDPFPRKLIHTVRGMGYVLEER